MAIKRKPKGIHCPKCMGQDLAAWVPAFWAAVDSEGEPEPSLHDQVESCTEATDRYRCVDCGHDWEL